VFDQIERTELELSMPMLEKVVSPVAHDVVHSVEVGRSHQASREVLENPTVTVVTNPLLDSMKHNHVNHRELGESPDGSIECAMHSSPLGREDVRLDGAAQIGLTLREELEIPGIDDISEPLQDGVEHEHVSPWELVGSPKGARVSVARPSFDKHVGMQAPLEVLSAHQQSPLMEHPFVTTSNSDVSTLDLVAASVGTQALTTSLVTVESSAIDGGMALGKDPITSSPHRQEVHPRKNIQLGLKLWDRVREFDARSVVEGPAGFMPILTRNQKQKLRVQHVLPKQPSKSRAWGDSQQLDQ